MTSAASRRISESRVGQQIERLCFSQLLAADRESEIGDGLVEEPRPRGAPGDVFLVQQLLDFVRKLIWPESASVAQPRTVTRERRVGFLRLEIGVVEFVELEREE